MKSGTATPEQIWKRYVEALAQYQNQQATQRALRLAKKPPVEIVVTKETAR